MEKSNYLSIRDQSSRDVWDFENAFYWFSHPTRLNKALAHYELYKTIVNLPGDIFELGVYKATSLLRFAAFRNLLENDFSRKIVGFDAFGRFPRDKLTLDVDVRFIDSFESAGGTGLLIEEVKKILEHKGFDNIDLVEGDIFQTLVPYLDSSPHVKIAMLHLDMDVKEPTEYALDILYDRLVPDGLIVFDDYAAVAGATEAVDIFVNKYRLKIQKMSNYHVPSYIRKPY